MDALTFTLIQTQLVWEDKKKNLAMLSEKIAGIKKASQVIVLPEMFTTGFSMNAETLAETMDGITMQWMTSMAKESRSAIVGSFIVKELNSFYNRLVWMLPNGQFGYYDKRHLFAYGGEHQHYASGNKRFIAAANGWKLNLQICYDLRFPVWARQQTPAHEKIAPEYDVLVYVANWPERRSLAWKTLLTARAIENQCYVIGVNRVGEDGNGVYHSGNSMVVDPLGKILYHCADVEDCFTIKLDKNELVETREKFPFWKDGDYFSII